VFVLIFLLHVSVFKILDSVCIDLPSPCIYLQNVIGVCIDLPSSCVYLQNVRQCLYWSPFFMYLSSKCYTVFVLISILRVSVYKMLNSVCIDLPSSCVCLQNVRQCLYWSPFFMYLSSKCYTAFVLISLLHVSVFKMLESVCIDLPSSCICLQNDIQCLYWYFFFVYLSSKC